MYVCGVTPYDATHLGHANTYVTFDMVNRVWRDAGHPLPCGMIRRVLQVNGEVAIPVSEVELRATRAGGPGGA